MTKRGKLKQLGVLALIVLLLVGLVTVPVSAEEEGAASVPAPVAAQADAPAPAADVPDSASVLSAPPAAPSVPDGAGAPSSAAPSGQGEESTASQPVVSGSAAATGDASGDVSGSESASGSSSSDVSGSVSGSDSSLTPVGRMGGRALPRDFDLLNAELTGQQMVVDGANINDGDSVVINNGSIIELSYSWRLKDDANPSEIQATEWTVLGKIPGALPLAGSLASQKYTLTTDPQATPVYTIGEISFRQNGADWDIVLTYSDEVCLLNDVTGSFKITGAIAVNGSMVPGGIIEVNMSEEILIKFEVPGVAVPTLAKVISRSVKWNGSAYVPSDNKFAIGSMFEWKITVNGNRTRNINGLVTDTLVQHQTFIQANIESGRDVVVSRTSGTPATLTRITSGTPNADTDGTYTLTYTNDKEIVIDLGTRISETYEILVCAEPNLASYLENQARNFINKATLKYGAADTQKVQAQAENWMTKPKALAKSGVVVAPGALGPDGLVNNTGNYVIDWAIDINRLAENKGVVTLTDTFGTGIQLLTQAEINNNALATGGDAIFRLFKLNVNMNGNTTAPGAVIAWGTANTVNGVTVSGSTLTFTADTATNQSYLLYCRTIVTDPEGLALLRGDAGITNTVKSTGWLDATATVKTGYSNGAPTLSKYAYDSINYADMTMGWQVHASSGQYNTKDHSFVLEDTFSINTTSGALGMALVQNSVEIYRTIASQPTGANIRDNFELVPRDPGDPEYTTGFVLKPKASAYPNGLNIAIVVYYRTTYRVETADAALGTLKGGTFYNSAKLTITKDPVTVTRTWGNVTQTVQPNSLSGVKQGVYHPGDPGNANLPPYIEWTIQFNQSAAALGQVTLNDVFGTTGMSFMGANSDLVIYKQGAPGAPLVQGTDYTITGDIAGRTSGFGLVIHNVQNWLVIQYKTKLNEPLLANYTNTANFTIASTGGVLTLPATVAMPKDTTLLQKSAVETAPGSGTYNWVVTLNQGNKTIENAVFTDTISRGLTLMYHEDAAMYAPLVKEGTTTLVGQKAGTTVPGADYEYRVDARNGADYTTTFEIKFLRTITSKITVEYQTRFDPNTAQRDPNNANKGSLSNNARLKGDAVDTWVEVKEYQAFIDITGDSDAKPFPVHIEKYDAETGLPLDGAVFEVWQNGSRIRDHIETTNGVFTNLELLAGLYTFKEVSPPPGYQLSTTPERTITINKTVANQQGGTIKIQYRNLPIETYTLRVRKTDADTGASLTGAVFNVLDSQNASVGTITVGSGGWGALPDKLPAGTYTLVETQAPDGYTLPALARTPVTLGPGLADNVLTVTIPNKKEDESIPASSSSSSSSTSSSQPQSSSSSSTASSSTASSVPPVSSAPPASEPAPSASSTPASSSRSVASSRSTVLPVPPVTPPTGGTPTPPGDGGTTTGPAAPTAPDPTIPVLEGSIIASDTNPGAAADRLNLGGVPLGGFAEGAAWSLLNLIMSLTSLFAAVVLAVSLLKRKKLNQAEDDLEEAYVPAHQANQDDEQEQRNRLLALRLPAMIMGVVPGILFLIFENIRLPITWITQWTPIIGAFFIIHMVLVLVHFVVKKRAGQNTTDQEEDPDMQPAY